MKKNLIIGALALTTLTSFGFAYSEHQRAEEQRLIAEEQRRLAQTMEALAKANEAEALQQKVIAEQQMQLAILNAKEAERQHQLADAYRQKKK